MGRVILIVENDPKNLDCEAAGYTSICRVEEYLEK